jgi:hypothetical protein
MDYGKLISHAWEIVWNNKWLLILGLLVSLGSGGTNGGGGSRYNYSGSEFSGEAPQEFNLDDLENLDEEDLEDFFSAALPIAGLGAAILIPLCCIIIVIGIALWVVGTIAGGALITGVDQIETRGESSFANAWRPAWQKGWRLVGINLVSVIPVVVFLLVLAGIGFATFGTVSNVAEDAMVPAIGGLIGLFAVLCCAFALVSIAISALLIFANRACMLEDTGVFESYGRGWEVLRANVGQAILILLIQVGISIGIGILMFLPGLCCLLWPLLLLVDAAKQTYFSTLWTLGWHEWTGSGGTPRIVEQVPAV